MTYPVPAVGTRLTADFLTSMLEITARKAGTTSRASTTVLANDPELTLAVEANAIYSINMGLTYLAASGVGVGGFSMVFTLPVGGAGDIMAAAKDTSGSAGFLNDQTLASDMLSTLSTDGLGAVNRCGLLMLGTFSTSGTAGSVTLQWAQRNSNATATQLRAGSYMTIKRIA